MSRRAGTSLVRGAPVARPPAGARSKLRLLRDATLAALLVAGTVTAGALPSAGAASAQPRLHAHVRRRHLPLPSATITTAAPPSATTTVATFLPLPAAPPPAPADTCFKANWAPAVQGVPASFAPGSDAAYLWYDADGAWALRFTHASAGDTTIFAGSLTATTGQFEDLSSLSAQSHDIVALSPNKRTIYFRFVDFSLLDGLNFATHCTRAFTVNIHEGGSLLAAAGVHLGSGSANPPGDPFKVTRGALLSAKVKQPAAK